MMTPDERLLLTLLVEQSTVGDKLGHPFRGNQYSDPEETFGILHKTAARQRAAEVYKGSGYKIINRYLRNRVWPIDVSQEAGFGKYIREKHAELIDGPQSNMDKLVSDMDEVTHENKTKRPTMVYRGVKGGKTRTGKTLIEQLSNNIGGTFRDDGFISTTPDFDTASDFGTNDGAIFKIELPEGTDYGYGAWEEQEMILPRGSVFKVIGAENETDDISRSKRTVFRLAYVPPESAVNKSDPGDKEGHPFRGNQYTGGKDEPGEEGEKKTEPGIPPKPLDKNYFVNGEWTDKRPHRTLYPVPGGGLTDKPPAGFTPSKTYDVKPGESVGPKHKPASSGSVPSYWGKQTQLPQPSNDPYGDDFWNSAPYNPGPAKEYKPPAPKVLPDLGDGFFSDKPSDKTGINGLDFSTPPAEFWKQDATPEFSNEPNEFASKQYVEAGWITDPATGEKYQEKFLYEKKHSSGAVLVEPDGRLWLVEPMNHFGGYDATFPKGRVEPDLNPRQNALKEIFEETGLQGQLTDYIADLEGDETITRYYIGKRVGGDPKLMGPEAFSVRLVDPDDALKLLNRDRDKKLLGIVKQHIQDTQDKEDRERKDRERYQNLLDMRDSPGYKNNKISTAAEDARNVAEIEADAEDERKRRDAKHKSAVVSGGAGIAYVVNNETAGPGSYFDGKVPGMDIEPESSQADQLATVELVPLALYFGHISRMSPVRRPLLVGDDPGQVAMDAAAATFDDDNAVIVLTSWRPDKETEEVFTYALLLSEPAGDFDQPNYPIVPISNVALMDLNDNSIALHCIQIVTDKAYADLGLRELLPPGWWVAMREFLPQGGRELVVVSTDRGREGGFVNQTYKREADINGRPST